MQDCDKDKMMGKKLDVFPGGAAFSGTLDTLVECKKRQHLREFQSIGKLIEVLALLCAGDTNKITDLLTGYLWDEEEAGMIKGAFNHGIKTRIPASRTPETHDLFQHKMLSVRHTHRSLSFADQFLPRPDHHPEPRGQTMIKRRDAIRRAVMLDDKSHEVLLFAMLGLAQTKGWDSPFEDILSDALPLAECKPSRKTVCNL